jgi:hypothetical protein
MLLLMLFARTKAYDPMYAQVLHLGERVVGSGLDASGE